MNNRLLFSALLWLATFAPCSYADTLRGRTAPLASPDQVPEGLAKSDWQSIRAAYEAGRHAFQPVEDGWQAGNPGQQWLTAFDGQGFTVTPDGGGWTWGLELAGYGKATGVQQEGEKLSYARADGLTEWFVNDTRGLEQGWTFAKRPERAGARGPVRLDFTVRGGLHPQVSPEGASVAFLNESGSAALTYGGLKAWDADGKTVPVRFVAGEPGGHPLGVVVEDTGAKYPITVDPIAQQAYLKASNTGAGDWFGNSVSVSGDTVVVGANGEDSSATGVNGNQSDNSSGESGAAYVFVRNGATWTQQAYLKASNTGANDYFGISVSVSGDTVVVGASSEASSATGVNGNQTDNSATSSGAAYVFVRNGAMWSQQAYLKASNTEAFDLFGTSVSVSGDTVVVGAYGEDSSATGVNGNQSGNSSGASGAAYVFVRNGETWSQQAYLKASNTGAFNNFGTSVSVSGDTVVVGASSEASSATGVNGNQTDNSATSSGAAYVFVRNGATWSQQAYLKASNTEASDLFGHSVAVSGDTVVVGAYVEDSSATGVNGNQSDNSAADSGAAYVFVRNGATWSQQAYLKASNTGAGDIFGYSVAVSGDTVVVGAYSEASSATGVNGNQSDNSVSASGAAYVFVRNGATWSQQAYLKASNTGAFDLFGTSVSVSGDTVVVGANGEDNNGAGQSNNSSADSGAAYVFRGLDASLTTSAVNGVVAGAGIYPPGATASLTAAPNPGYLFNGWTGDASGTANPFTLIMEGNKTIGADFVPDLRDSDGDGLSNFAESVTHGTDPAKADSDGDGLSDGYELGVGRYEVVLGIRTWAQAKVDAEAKGGTLATLLTLEKWNQVQKDIGPDALLDINGLWIGATDSAVEGSWKWLTGDAVSWSNWAGGQPDNLNDSDFAAIAGDLGGDTGKWYDYRSATTRDGYLFESWFATDPQQADVDGDGLNDGQEKAAGSNPFLADSDGDGLTDAEEVNLTKTNPSAADSDGDGLTDAADDQDGDGLPNLAEIRTHSTNPILADTDGDGLTDGVELATAGSFYQVIPGSFTQPQAAADATARHGRLAAFPSAAVYARTIAKIRRSFPGYLWLGLSDGDTEGVWKWTDGSEATYTRWMSGQPDGGGPESCAVIVENAVTWADAAPGYTAAGYLLEQVGLNPLATDTDSDGLSDQAEVVTENTDPFFEDSDRDGLGDGEEVNQHHTNPKAADSDGDGLSDRVELVEQHTNPNRADSDDDGFSDLFEINTGFDPNLATSSPEAISSIKTAIEFSFNAANGVSYRIEQSTDLENWSTLETNILGAGDVVTRYYPIRTQGTRYFRPRRN